MPTKTHARIQRARVAALTRYRDASDPDLIEARELLYEEAFVAAVERALRTAPPIRPELRDRVMGLLSAGASE